MSLGYDHLLSTCQSWFNNISDHRKSNKKISLADMLNSALAMFTFKYPSMLALDSGRMKSEDANLKSLFGIKNIPSDTALRETLDEVSPDVLHGLFGELFNKVQGEDRLKSYAVFDNHLICAMDGVQFFSSKSVKCQYCQQKTLKNDDVVYSHGMLGAVVVHPDHPEVLPLGAEPIQHQDGNTKNDHELNSAKRLWNRLWDEHPTQKFLHLGDALFANGPMIRHIEERRHSYLLNVKPDSHQTLFAHFEHPQNQHAYEHKKFTVKGEKIEAWFINNLPLNNSAGDVRVNFLIVNISDSKGKKTTFTWVTNIPISTSNVVKLSQYARARWKIENETFNTLKNQGYNFEHNYGHGYKHLANTLAILMLLAFLIDQIQQMSNKVFIQLIKVKKTRTRLWEDMRSAFKIKNFNSFKHLLEYLIANTIPKTKQKNTVKHIKSVT